MKAVRNMMARLTGVACAMGIMLAATTSQASDLDDFYGHYEGIVVLDQEVEAEQGGNSRTTSVDIIEEDNGFRINWSTIITKKGGRIKTAQYSIHFQETEKDGTFSSAMKKNMFGNWIPLNPLKGDPYVWATLEGETLSVYALIIPEEGGYEMQQYDRTLLPNGNLDLTFKRVKDGTPLKTITGVLARK